MSQISNLSRHQPQEIFDDPPQYQEPPCTDFCGVYWFLTCLECLKLWEGHERQGEIPTELQMRLGFKLELHEKQAGSLQVQERQRHLKAKEWSKGKRKTR